MNVVAQASASGLSGAWGNARSMIDSTLPGLLNVLAGIGIIMILIAVVKFFWDKRRGNGADSKRMWFLIGAGAILAAPNALMPFFLTIVDWAIMGIMHIANFFTGQMF